MNTGVVYRESDPRYLERRYREFIECLQPYAKELTRIYSLMPQKIKVDLITKELTYMVEPEWQKVIDKVTEIRDKMIKLNFPEFYNPKPCE